MHPRVALGAGEGWQGCGARKLRGAGCAKSWRGSQVTVRAEKHHDGSRDVESRRACCHVTSQHDA
eukprot:3007118-Rhodomonas_salina.1